jgi:uncharacterized RDD family membrane protein YckC
MDLLVAGVCALLLSGSPGRWFARRAVVTLSIGTQDTLWRGPVPMVLGILGEFVYVLPLALLLVLLPEAVFGAGPGKWALGLHVAAADGSEPGARRRLLRYTVKCCAPWVMVLALVAGSMALAEAAFGAGAVVLAGLVLAAGRQRQALHDRLSGTAVYSG